MAADRARGEPAAAQTDAAEMARSVRSAAVRRLRIDGIRSTHADRRRAPRSGSPCLPSFAGTGRGASHPSAHAASDVRWENPRGAAGSPSPTPVRGRRRPRARGRRPLARRAAKPPARPSPRPDAPRRGSAGRGRHAAAVRSIRGRSAIRSPSPSATPAACKSRRRKSNRQGPRSSDGRSPSSNRRARSPGQSSSPRSRRPPSPGRTRCTSARAGAAPCNQSCRGSRSRRSRVSPPNMKANRL